MLSINDYFSKLKNTDDKDDEQTLEYILEQWEKFINNDKNITVTMLNDYNICSTTVRNSKILMLLFDNTLISDNFTCVNSSLFDRLCEKTRINNKMNFKIYRSCDCINKLFLRFTLNDNIEYNDIDTVLDSLSNCQITISIGGTNIYKINIMFILLIYRQLSIDIRYIDVKQYMDTLGTDEIKNILKSSLHDNCYIGNQKYYFLDKNDKYLDIPLLFDFFTYSASIPLIALRYHEISITLDNLNNDVYKYIKSVNVMCEELYYYDSKPRQQIAQQHYDLLKMELYNQIYCNYCKNDIEVNCGKWHSKFTFICIKPSNKHQFYVLPNIESIVITYDDLSTKTVNYDKMYIATFNDCLFYGIANNGYSDMKNWINVKNECIDDNLEITKQSHNINNYNYDEVYTIKRIMKIYVSFTPYNEPIDIHIWNANQNIFRIMSGMAGNAYSA